MARFDPKDEGFRARTAAVNAQLRQWNLVGASGSWLEAHLMARAALVSGGDRVVGTCVTPTEVLDLIRSHKERCLLVMVDSIAADHGEAVVAQLQKLPRPPVIILMVETMNWLGPNTYPFDQVDALMYTHSFGSGALLDGLATVSQGQRYVDPAVLNSIKAQNHRNHPKITPREHETLLEVANGLTNRQLAHRLGIAESTAQEYTRSLLKKFNVPNRTMLVRTALELGLLVS